MLNMHLKLNVSKTKFCITPKLVPYLVVPISGNGSSIYPLAWTKTLESSLTLVFLSTPHIWPGSKSCPLQLHLLLTAVQLHWSTCCPLTTETLSHLGNCTLTFPPPEMFFPRYQHGFLHSFMLLSNEHVMSKWHHLKDTFLDHPISKLHPPHSLVLDTALFSLMVLNLTFYYIVHFWIASILQEGRNVVCFVYCCLPITWMRNWHRGGTPSWFTLCPSKFSPIRKYCLGSYRCFPVGNPRHSHLCDEVCSPLECQEPSGYTCIHLRVLPSNKLIEVELLGHEPNFQITIREVNTNPSPISRVVFQYILGL